jgi:DNA topoisomerase-1
MPKSLLIVESPTKVKTLQAFLGPSFKIMGSQGHVRDLPKSGLSVDIEHDFEPKYELLEDRKHIISALREAAKGVDTVYLASDPDREGEAIAWHIGEALKLKNAQRIEFNEITKSAVQKALANPRAIDMQRVNAQQARRVLDRIIGYKVSPLLARKISKGLSAGRVQSVALRLICEREREISAFVIEEYWSVTAILTPQTEEFPFPAKLISRAGKKYDKLGIKTEDEAQDLVALLSGQEYVVEDVKRREKKRHAPAPFITSTLQQEASKQLGFSAKRTMQTAQRLYEGVALEGGETVGLITYMRTDSTSIAKEAQQAAREYIEQRFGADFLPKTPPVFKNRKSAQEAHECIRPSYVERTPQSVEKYMERDQFRLYQLIWRRFVASQMMPAIMDVTTVDIKAGEFGLRASGSIIKFAGFLSVYEESKDEDKSDDIGADDENAERNLPDLKAAQVLELLDLLPRQHFTQPPPRYTEATLVKSLEENGIGRPSTYASIISTIQDRGYVELEQKRFTPTDLGLIVSDKLVQHFPDVVDVHFTAEIESKLDAVEEGQQNWVDLLKAWYAPFAEELKKATDEMERVGPVETDFDCPVCGKKLLLRRGRFGEFFSCSDYPECKTSMNVGPDGTPQPREEKATVTVEGVDLTEARECEKCGKPMVVRASKMGAFWGCTGYPKCKNLVPIEGATVTGIAVEEPEITEHLCPHCNRPLALRKGRFGPFLGCTGYPECKTIIKVNKEGDPRWDTATSPLGSAKMQAAAAEKEAKAAARAAEKEAKAAEKEAAKAAPKTAVKKTAAKKPAAKKAPAKKAAPAPAQKPVTKKSLARAKAEAEA